MSEQTIKIGNFEFDNADIIKSIFITSSTEPVTKIQLLKVNDSYYSGTQIVGFEIHGHDGSISKYALKPVEAKQGSTQHEIEKSLFNAFETLKRGFELKYDDHKEIRLLTKPTQIDNG